MKTSTEIITNTVYQSECFPEIRTINASLTRIIVWADEHPVVLRIVTERRSKAFGIGSSVYIGWAQKSKEPDAILERVRHMFQLAQSYIHRS